MRGETRCRQAIRKSTEFWSHAREKENTSASLRLCVRKKTLPIPKFSAASRESLHLKSRVRGFSFDLRTYPRILRNRLVDFNGSATLAGPESSVDSEELGGSPRNSEASPGSGCSARRPEIGHGVAGWSKFNGNGCHSSAQGCGSRRGRVSVSRDKHPGLSEWKSRMEPPGGPSRSKVLRYVSEKSDGRIPRDRLIGLGRACWQVSPPGILSDPWSVSGLPEEGVARCRESLSLVRPWTVRVA